MWKHSNKKLPNVGDSILVKTLSGEVFYAMYSGEDEFDIHRPDEGSDTRKAWYKHSSRSVIKWRYFA